MISSRRFQCESKRIFGGNEALPLLVDEVVHPDVVLGDVLARLGAGPGDREVDLGGNALAKPVGQARLGPLPPRPSAALGELLLEREDLEIQRTVNASLFEKKSSTTCAPGS